jgi:hypothetical protein
MKRHFTAYFEAYLTGSLFFVLQIALGFVAVGKGAPLDVRMKWTAFDWYTFKANVIIFAFPTILAFLNSSVARGRANAAANEQQESNEGKAIGFVTSPAALAAPEPAKVDPPAAGV